MIDVTQRGNFDAAEAYLDRIIAGFQDMGPLGEAIREIMVEDNARARLAGVDRFGVALAPLRGGRPLTRREIDDRGGTGEPLDPKGMASRAITDFEVSITPYAPGGDLSIGELHVVGQWPTIPWLAYHSMGAGRLPVRDIIGAPTTIAQVDEAATGYFDKLTKVVFVAPMPGIN